MKKPTSKEILLEWLRALVELGHTEVFSHQIENDLPLYGQRVHGKLHIGSNYSRRWREVIESGDYRKAGITSVTEIPPHVSGRSDKGWRLHAAASDRVAA